MRWIFMFYNVSILFDCNWKEFKKKKLVDGKVFVSIREICFFSLFIALYKEKKNFFVYFLFLAPH